MRRGGLHLMRPSYLYRLWFRGLPESDISSHFLLEADDDVLFRLRWGVDVSEIFYYDQHNKVYGEKHDQKC